MTQPERLPTHIPVMVRETLAALEPASGHWYADATAGSGGHAEAILQASEPRGRLLAVDRDPEAVQRVRERLRRFGTRALVLHADFGELHSAMASVGVERVDGLVADLGLSSTQLDDARRGFSFGRPGPLDMRMDPTQGETALQLVEHTTEAELATLIRHYSGERAARPIARAIKRAAAAGRLDTTEDLRRVVTSVLGSRRRGRIDPATRTFQALRVAVNSELSQLSSLLALLRDVLQDDGVAVLISYHSLEDRLVKHAFRDDPALSPLYKRPLTASDEEVQTNRRARSAKLRAARRLKREAAA